MAERARREARRIYLEERRREVDCTFIAAVLEAENCIALQDDAGRPTPMAASDAQSLQAKIVHAQGLMMLFGSEPAVIASSQSMGEMIGALRGVVGPTADRDGLSRLVSIARSEFADEDGEP